jgi:seryl-tRNA synthetase
MPERAALRKSSMHDIKAIRDNPEAFDEGLKKRRLGPLSADALKHDAELRALLTRLQTAQARRNEASKLIGAAKAKKDEAQASALMAEVSGLKDEIQKGEEDERRLQTALNDFLAGIPNIPASDVPEGDESANKEIRRWGTKPNFAFKPKQHFDLGEGLGQMDFEAAARMSGARFVVLKNQLARLERAIAQFMLDLHTDQTRENNLNEKLEIGGYAEISPPLMVRDQALFGTNQLPKFEDDLFFAVSGDQFPGGNWLEELRQSQDTLARDMAVTSREHRLKSGRFGLIPTAEVPLTNLVREQILDDEQLPLRFTAYTPCFRAEAGAAGKDTRGMIRMHQFSKVELVSITGKNNPLPNMSA